MRLDTWTSPCVRFTLRGWRAFTRLGRFTLKVEVVVCRDRKEPFYA